MQASPHLQWALPEPVMPSLVGQLHGLHPQCSPHEHRLCSSSPPLLALLTHLPCHAMPCIIIYIILSSLGLYYCNIYIYVARSLGYRHLGCPYLQEMPPGHGDGHPHLSSQIPELPLMSAIFASLIQSLICLLSTYFNSDLISGFLAS